MPLGVTHPLSAKPKAAFGTRRLIAAVGTEIYLNGSDTLILLGLKTFPEGGIVTWW